MAIPLTLQPIQTASNTTPTTTPPPITPLSPNSRPSTADSALKSPVSASTASSATAAQEKRKTSRRANTAERRATHNAVERQRRETLNGRFLDLATLLPNLTSVRRPSKSAIVNSSIALIHQSRRQKALAALELRALYTQFLALKAEADEWRARAGVGCVEEGERSREFWEMIREGEEVLKGAATEGGGEKEAMRRVREIGEEEGRARVLAEAAASTSHGSGSAGAGRRDSADGDDDFLGDDGMEDDLPVPVPTVATVAVPQVAVAHHPQVVHHHQHQHHHIPTHHQVVVPASEPTAVPVPVPMTVTSSNSHLAHQQHLAQVHAQAQAQIQAAQMIQQQQQQQRVRANTVSVPQDNRIFAHQVPTAAAYPTQYQQQMHHVHQMQQQQQHHQPQQQPFDSGADLFNFSATDHLGLYNAYSAPSSFDIKSEPHNSPNNTWPGLTVAAPVSPPFLGGGDDSSSSSSSAGGSPSPVVGRSRAGSMTVAQAQVVGAAGFY